MTAVMEGVRILEVAEHTFVPAASALLADWGAEVIKIEHVERGDAMRGLAATGVVSITGDVHALLEHSNRGKRSLGPRPDHARRARHPLQAGRHRDVFLTNKLPRVRTKLNIERRGHPGAQPEHHLRARHRPGRARARRRQGLLRLPLLLVPGRRRPRATPSARVRSRPVPPAPGFGDSIGGHDHRRRDHGRAVPPRAHRRGHDRRRVAARHRHVGHGPGLRPVAGQRHALGRPAGGRAAAQPARRATTRPRTSASLSFCCLQAGRYWADALRGGRPARARPPTRASPTTPALVENSLEAQRAHGARPSPSARVAEWRERLADFTGQWAVVQDTLEAAADPQTRRQRLHAGLRDGGRHAVPARGRARAVRRASRPPVRRAPEFNEHGDAILEELGLDWDTIVDLKVRGVVG